MTTAAEQIGLRDLRLDRGLTLAELGELAGVSEATCSRIERGLVEPYPATLVGLARALGIPVRRLREMLARNGVQ